MLVVPKMDYVLTYQLVLQWLLLQGSYSVHISS